MSRQARNIRRRATRPPHRPTATSAGIRAAAGPAEGYVQRNQMRGFLQENIDSGTLPLTVYLRSDRSQCCYSVDRAHYYTNVNLPPINIVQKYKAVQRKQYVVFV